MISINPEKVERVLLHMIESHGLRFPATVMGQYVPEFKLASTTKVIGVGQDTQRSIFLFGAIVEGTQFLFEIERAKLKLFQEWVEKAFENLGTEKCAMFAKMPSDMMVYANVSQCTSGLKSYVKSEGAEASVT